MSYALALANPGSDIDKYLSQVYSIPVLTREEELELTQEFYKTEDVKVAHKLVISHLRFVVHIAKSYSGYGLPISDVIQEGNVGLLKAVKKFDPDKGAIRIEPCLDNAGAGLGRKQRSPWPTPAWPRAEASVAEIRGHRGREQRLSWPRAEPFSWMLFFVFRGLA